MKALTLIILIPALALAWELPPDLELVSREGDNVTVKDARTGMLDTYLVGGEPVINGWALEIEEDSLVFELVADLNMYLIEDLQSYDFMGDGYNELVGCDVITDNYVLFLENTGNFNFAEVNRIESGNILYDLGDADDDGLIEILTKYERSMYIFEQTSEYSYADSLVWQITPLSGNYRVWPRFSDLDNDGLQEVSFNNSIGFYKIDIYENTGDNDYGHYFNIPWPYAGPGQFAGGDFDGDGNIEIIGGDPNGILTVFETVESDSFDMVWQQSLGHPNAYMHRFIGDSDQNGYSEWVSGSHDFTRGGFFFKVYEAVGDNQYEVVYYDSLPGNPWNLGGVDAGDIDGDISPEFIFSSNFNVGVYKYAPITGWHRVWHLDSLQGTVIPYLVDTDGDNICEIIINSNVIPGYTRIYRLLSTDVESENGGFEDWLRVFPNPTNDRIIFNFSLNSTENFSLDIFDIKGRKVISRTNIKTNGNIIWNLKDGYEKRVGSGIYFIKISNLDFEYVKKFTILK